MTAQYLLTAPARLQAQVDLPASKSICNRALVIQALTPGCPRPDNLSDCDDTRAMVQALATMPPVVDIGAAGTAMRFLTALLSVTPGTRVLTGTARMQQRPIGLLVDALWQLGAQIAYEGRTGFPPLRIVGGELQGGEVELPGSVSSQYVSALLLIAPALPRGLRLRLTGDIVSHPYIDLTLDLMHTYGAQAAWISDHVISVQPGGYRGTPFRVENDWSAASYWYEAVALSAAPGARTALPGTVELRGLFAHSAQGDSRGADLFARLGVHTDFTADGVRLTAQPVRPARLDADLVDMPDLAQTFVVTCCLADIPFRFDGLQSLRIKETDRLAALQAELHKLGYVLQVQDDRRLSWDGTRTDPQPDPAIDTYEDHRMAMAFAPACLLMPHVRINHPQVVSKSYPAYWDDLRRAGFGIG